jgi:hypothetical protein
MDWAFRAGNTTKAGAVGRGMGLDLLKHFVEANRGRLEILSHDAYASIDAHGKSFDWRPNFFPGTLVNIKLECDDSYYCLPSEGADRPLF